MYCTQFRTNIRLISIIVSFKLKTWKKHSPKTHEINHFHKYVRGKKTHMDDLICRLRWKLISLF